MKASGRKNAENRIHPSPVAELPDFLFARAGFRNRVDNLFPCLYNNK